MSEEKPPFKVPQSDRCMFCYKHKEDLKPKFLIVAHWPAAICQDCIATCLEIVADKIKPEKKETKG